MAGRPVVSPCGFYQIRAADPYPPAVGKRASDTMRPALCASCAPAQPISAHFRPFWQVRPVVARNAKSPDFSELFSSGWGRD